MDREEQREALGRSPSAQLAEELRRLRETVDAGARRLDGFDTIRDDVRKLSHLADTVAQQATDNARRVTNAEQRVTTLERALSEVMRVQENARVAEMAPRELAVLPEVCRDFIDRQEAEETLEERLDRRMRNLAAMAGLAQAVFALAAVLLSYLVSRHP